ncbi:MAG: DNA primase [Flavobacteriales bacterium]
MISKRTVEIVLETARIEDVVGDYVVLKRRGANLLGLCPFHNEKSPSFTVSPAKGIYKCFGCGASGNAVGFVMDHDKLNFPEAIKQLAKRYHIEVEETAVSVGEKEELKEKESMMLVNEFAGKYLEQKLWETEEGRSIAYTYFKERGFSDETIRKFNLGYSPDGWSTFTDDALKAGYNLIFLVKTGLTIEKDGKHFDRFRGRVMFPIHNVSGKVIAFGGRILGNDKKLAKYVNSPESEVYYKSKALYGIHLARKQIIQQDLCYLVEGYTDVISLHQAGIENVVASSGTSLTEDQIRIIHRYSQNITILYDGDSAGIKASFRGIDMILSQGMNVKIVLFPDGDDPDSFARKNNPLYIQSYLKEHAQDFIDFKLKVLKEETGDDPIKKAIMIKDMVQSVALIPDPIIRSVYAKACARKLDTDESVLLDEITKLIKLKKQKGAFKADEAENVVQDKQKFIEQNEEAAQEKPKTDLRSQISFQERNLVRLLVQYANELIYFPSDNGLIEIRVGDYILDDLLSDTLDFENQTLKKIVELFLVEEGMPYPMEKELLQHSDSVIVDELISLVTSKHELSKNWQQRHNIIIPTENYNLKKAVLSAVYSFKIRKLELMESEMSRQLEHENDEDKMLEILTKLKLLLDIKQTLGKELQYVVMR